MKIGSHKICIPHPDRVAHRDLPHKQTIHPAKSKLHKLHSLRLKMMGQCRVYSSDEFGHSTYGAVDPGLRKNIIILYPV